MSRDNGNNPDPQLAEKIRELEALLDARDNSSNAAAPRRDANIPVLDEVVAPADEPDEGNPGHNTPLPQEIAILAQRLEQKFSMELDEILRVLKGNLKDSIARELRSHLTGRDVDGNKPGGGPTGKRSED
jgi:hypothetical protein